MSKKTALIEALELFKSKIQVTPEELEAQFPSRRATGLVWELRKRGHIIEQVKTGKAVSLYTLKSAAVEPSESVPEVKDTPPQDATTTEPQAEAPPPKKKDPPKKQPSAPPVSTSSVDKDFDASGDDLPAFLKRY
jgi:outer membrane biosynthesis protein TonB